MSFPDFFEAATDHAPYAYQCRLACGEGARLDDDSTLVCGTGCRSQLIEIPTGLGKTAAVVLAWLWNRVIVNSLNDQPSTINQRWPRRLVYCLPMRTLVEQTRDNVRQWLKNLGEHEWQPGTSHEGKVGVHILMGGEDDGEWDIHPEREAILIGTQDMLLSRALNRGYAAGRARWPKDFGLLNNDCLWLFDEVQLMSTGFATSLQLQAWREETHPASSVHSWWMSATVEKEWLATSIDFTTHSEKIWKRAADQSKKLWEGDSKGDTPAAKRLASLLKSGTKTLNPSAVSEFKGDDAKVAKYIGEIATKISARIKETDSRVLIILNTVVRACALADSLKDHSPFLLHSRFRHHERKKWPAKLQSERLIIATQVIEAGVDISAKVLFTELCPWPSFIQRCGRAARYSDETAEVFWLDVSKSPQPYPEDELTAAKEELGKLTDVSLAGFRSHRASLKPDHAHRLLPYEPRFVPQLRDLLELFDTTPDLTGADIDISRFIRDGEEHDISVFWRDCTGIKPGKKPPKAKRWQPEHAELCPVPVAGFREFAKQTKSRIWRWDYRDGWTRLDPGDAERIFPGQVFLLEKACGGYHPLNGWTGRPEDEDFEIGPWKNAPSQHAENQTLEDNAPGTQDDVESSDGGSNTGQSGQWRDILTHSREVCEELAKLVGGKTALPAGDVVPVLCLAARLHDWGKAHAAFKGKVKSEELAKAKNNGNLPDGLPAKAPDHCWRREKLKPQAVDKPEAELDHRRPGFRHELASSLAILELLRRHRPGHASLAWPDAELRAAFPEPEILLAEPLPDSAKPLAKECADLSPAQFNQLLYLVAAHHGKVRLSLRSSPDDQREEVPQPCPPDKRQARGVRDDDKLPSVTLPGKDFATGIVYAPPLTLHLDVMELGLSPPFGPSWRERMNSLLQQHGPFRLAWYEALLRIADQRASIRAQAATPLA